MAQKLCRGISAKARLGHEFILTSFASCRGRQLALMHALVQFAHIAGSSTFTTAELYPEVLDVLGCSSKEYGLASLRYDLLKLRAKALVDKLPHSRKYRLLPCGYSVSLIFLKLFE